MPYVEIGGQPVFLSKSRYMQLREEVLKEKSSLFKVLGMFKGTEQTKEAQSLMIAALEKKYADNPARFHQEWLEFDMDGEEARENVWDLLYDYCHFYGYALLRDFRDPFERLIDDKKYSDAFDYPMGRVFALDHHVRPGRWWWRYTQRMHGRTVRVIIMTNIVNRLVGSLQNFTIFTPWLQIRCGENFELFPIPRPPHHEADS